MSHYTPNDDDIILFLIHPGLSIRTEGVLNAVYSEIEIRRPGKFVAGIYGYQKLEATQKYIKNRKLNYLPIIDTSLCFFDEIGFFPNAPIVTRWDKSGRLLYSTSVLGLDLKDTLLWTNLLGPKEQIKPLENYMSKNTFTQPVLRIASLTKINQFISIPHSSDYPIGRLVKLTCSNDLNYLIATDGLTWKKIVFDLGRKKIIQEIYPDKDTRKHLSSDCSEAYFQAVENSFAATTLPFPVDSLKDEIGAFMMSLKVVDNYLFIIWKLKDKNQKITYSKTYILQKYNIQTRELIFERRVPASFTSAKLETLALDNKAKKLVCLYANSQSTICVFYDLLR